MLQSNPKLSDLVSQASEDFQAAYGKKPEIVVASPGRVNLIGEHIDYCDGYVLPMAIERYIVIAIAENGTQNVRVSSKGQAGEISLTEAQYVSDAAWTNYLRGVIDGFQKRGDAMKGFDAAIVSSVPAGGGLSSSAALECAFAQAIKSINGIDISPRDAALLCQKAEHNFAGVPCGIMDQFACTLSKEDCFLLLDCRSTDTEMIPLLDKNLTVLVINSKVSHQLADGAYAKRRQATIDGLAIIGKQSWREVVMADLLSVKEKMSEEMFRRCRHVIGEIERVELAVKALEKKEYTELGKLMAASHASLKDDFEVSCEELDLLVELANKHNIIGARMTGGGFGGSIVVLCDESEVEKISQAVHQEYLAKTGITPEIFASRPMNGVGVVS